MIERLTNMFIGTAHAQTKDWFDIFSIMGGGSSNLAPERTFNNVVGYIMGWVLAVVAIIAFVYLIISGVNYITAGGDSEKATKARNGILNAIIGIVVVVVAFFILRFAASLGAKVGNQ